MTELYKKEDVIAFLNLHCPKDMWEYQIADLNTVKVMEYADKEQAYMTGYERGRIEGFIKGVSENATTTDCIKKQVTGKLKNADDSLLTEDSEACKEQKSKLDCISRQQAIEALGEEPDIARDTDEEWAERDAWARHIRAIESLSPVTPKPVMTEEVREALMRLTMCAREECTICKYENNCGFDKQVEMATENMNIILNAFDTTEQR